MRTTRSLIMLKLSIIIEQSNYNNDHDHTVFFSRKKAMKDQILSCEFFLDIIKDTVTLVYQSVKNYFLRKTNDSNAELKTFRIKKNEENLKLAR